MIGFPDMRRRHYPPPLVDKAARVVRAVKTAGIPCEFTEEIEKHLWAKLLYNCALNPLGAIHQVHYGALAEKAEWRALMDGVVREIFAVAKAKGIALFWEKPEGFLELFYSKLVPDTYHHRSSMLQDLEKGRRTEIDSLCGIVVRYGREAGVETPLNREMFESMQALSGRGAP
jgi:2-dehydropantoate 2-reductase